MRSIIITTLVVLASFVSKGQAQESLSDACKHVSSQWKIDSNGCNGDREKVADLLTNARPDSISKTFIFSTLGIPNMTEKYFSSYPKSGKKVEYIYFIYKDDCHNIYINGASIGFVFDETETHFIRLTTHIYCG